MGRSWVVVVMVVVVTSVPVAMSDWFAAFVDVRLRVVRMWMGRGVVVVHDEGIRSLDGFTSPSSGAVGGGWVGWKWRGT
jgi:uncharacterized protein YaaW (UPF0174 family)